MKVMIMGMGEIGKEIYDELNKGETQVLGIDINPGRILELKEKGYAVKQDIKEVEENWADIIIISVYTTDQIIKVIESIKFTNHPLISIESTIDPEKGSHLKFLSERLKFDLVLFPHRYNPRDKEHHIFNIDRVLGGVTKKAVKRAYSFFNPYFEEQGGKIHEVSYETAIMCKPIENAYRYLEIAFAEELKIRCDQLGFDFDELREAMNTKWNINVMEAREGIGLTCLPKDCKLSANCLKSNLLNTAQVIDLEYRQHIAGKKLSKK